jgi:stage II sporulation protein D
MGDSADDQPVPEVDRALQPIPRVVRVGLATDLESVTLPCCSGDIVAVFGRREVAMVANLVVEPGVEIAASGVWRLQVAALRDERQALDLARRIGERLGLESGVVFDAGTGLYRVRAGAFDSRDDAEDERLRLAQQNIHDAWIVSEREAPKDPVLKLQQGEREWMVRGRWLAFEPLGGTGVSVLGKRYRGRILVLLNNRGTLNVINEVALDDYLRGVVPREMGPAIFDDLDALKAQAVAARTYTLRNMGEFEGEGYDICATPRCQVYGGMDAEHELSDRAVLETSREVLLFDGEYVDAMYSSTCGGHTENVATMFPLKQEPYLKGVSCFEAGVDRIAGTLKRQTSLEVGIMQGLIPSAEPQGSASDMAVRLQLLARLAGLPTRSDSLSSLERREVQRFIASQFDMAVDARLLVNQQDIPYLLESPPPDWSSEDLRLAAYLVQAGLLSGVLDRPLDEWEVEETLFHLSLFLRVLEERKSRYMGLEGGDLLVKERSEIARYEVPRTLATFSKRSGRFTATPLALVPGDRLRLFVSGNRLLGIAHEVDLDGVAYDRTSNMSTWRRFRSEEDLRKLVAQRYPSLEFSDFEILERGVSGRVGRLRIRGRDGRTVDVEGLPIRWTLDLPDTLFTARRLTPPGSSPGWLFSGRGWGHGVGLCQVGSYGMATRGHDYRDILQHYYSGVELRRAPLEQVGDTAVGPQVNIGVQ